MNKEVRSTFDESIPRNVDSRTSIPRFGPLAAAVIPWSVIVSRIDI